MRILWVSNAPWSSVGYGNQTRLFAPRLQAMLGHDVAILSFYGLEGAVLQVGDGAGRQMPIYPKGFHPYGQDVVGATSGHFRADVTISLMDAWVCQPELYGPHTRWAPWFPIDHEPLPAIIRNKVAGAFRPITMSRFGQAQAEQAGIESAYVPHGVDTAVFSPGDQAAARGRTRLPADRFIVGMVAANKGTPSRKAFPQQLMAFAQFRAKHPDSLLYLHTGKGAAGENQGVNLPELCEHLGITDAVIFPDQYQNLLGFPDEAMADLYRSFDVLLSVSMGEGFGIPILEAQACGTPVIVGDWTSMTELCFDGWAIPKADAEPYWTPLAAYQYLPHPGAIAEALEAAYGARDREKMGRRAAHMAREYDADRVARDYWAPVLDDIAARIEAPTPSSLAELDAPAKPTKWDTYETWERVHPRPSHGEWQAIEKQWAGLGAQYLNTLKRAGYYTLEQVAAASDEELRRAPGVGDEVLKTVRAFVALKLGQRDTSEVSV